MSPSRARAGSSLGEPRGPAGSALPGSLRLSPRSKPEQEPQERNPALRELRKQNTTAGHFQDSSLEPNSHCGQRTKFARGLEVGVQAPAPTGRAGDSLGDSGHSRGRRPCSKAPATHGSNRGGTHLSPGSSATKQMLGLICGHRASSVSPLCISGHHWASMGINRHPRASTGMGEGACRPWGTSHEHRPGHWGPWAQGCGLPSWQKTCPHMQTPQGDRGPRRGPGLKERDCLSQRPLGEGTGSCPMCVTTPTFCDEF